MKRVQLEDYKQAAVIMYNQLHPGDVAEIARMTNKSHQVVNYTMKGERVSWKCIDVLDAAAEIIQGRNPNFSLEAVIEEVQKNREMALPTP